MSVKPCHTRKQDVIMMSALKILVALLLSYQVWGNDDVIASKIFVIEKTAINFETSELKAQFTNSLILSVTRIKDVHLVLAEEFDPKNYINTKSALFSLKSSVTKINDNQFQIKVILFDENQKKIIKRIKSKTVNLEHILETFDQALKILSENLDKDLEAS